jgi:hypothetical protein
MQDHEKRIKVSLLRLRQGSRTMVDLSVQLRILGDKFPPASNLCLLREERGDAVYQSSSPYSH